MARPKTKGDPIHIRLREDEHARYCARAATEGVSLAVYVTNVLSGALRFLDGEVPGVRADAVRYMLTAPVGVGRLRDIDEAGLVMARSQPYEDGSAWVADRLGTVGEATLSDVVEMANTMCVHPKPARKTTAAGMMICSCGMVKGPDGTWRTP